MSRESRLIKNTFIYTIGNFGTKILSFLIVPLYTYYIKPDEFGIYDLLCTAVTLCVPLLTLQLSEVVIYWMLDASKNRESVVHCVMYVFIVNIVFCSIVFLLASCFVSIPYGFYMMILLPVKSVYTILLQITRGYEKNKLYAASGIIYNVIFLSINVVFIIGFQMGIKGLLISEAIASGLMAVLLLFMQPGILRSFRVSYPRQMRGELIRYALPLIPNSVAWWVISLSDRLVIKAFLGDAANGVYALSNKFPAIIQMFTSIFYLAWQETAMLTYENEDREAFFGSIFKKYYRVMFAIGFLAISVTEVVIMLILSEDYKSSWQFTSFLYLGTVFNAFASFYNTSYLKENNTKGILGTTFLGAAVNLVVNLLLVKPLGLYAASISTFASNLVLFAARVIGTRKSCLLDVEWREFGALTALGIFYAVIFSIKGLYVLKAVLFIIALIIAVGLNYGMLKELVYKVKSKMGR